MRSYLTENQENNFLVQFNILQSLCFRAHWVWVSTGIPGYGLRTEIIRIFFSISIMHGKSSVIPEFRNDFFIRKPEISETLFRNYGSFRNIKGKSFRNFPGKVPEKR